ncbi:hypothetical protein CALVIDRAFT_96521 [Calocera viscosa TUFC12733]|uniref:Uncharacterized protein n=1 Tax=Calocera viscosa (strain TUFC12733) TaxID=1330018 RepID=A0A167MYY0_CALVF|nr:hypothetical protein CALVIDRAFT_96521 [Calocera viscosa TUFC12733]
MDLLDTAWCPVCDRMIPPAILVAPPSAPTTAPPSPVPTQQSIKTRGGTIKAAPGARRPAGHARSKSSANVISSPVPAPSTSSPPKKEKVKTYISQAPTPLYCSPECELRDAMSLLTVSIPPSPTQATYAAYGRHAPQPPSSPIMISGSSSSSDAGGSYGSPFSNHSNSDYFAFLEGRAQQAANTGSSSAESLSSLNQLPSRALPPTRTPASRSRRPSSSSLAPRAPHSAGYAHSPPADSSRQYTLSFTRAPASTASPSSSPPAISIIAAHAARRERSLSRASSSLREAAGLTLPMSPGPSVRSIPRSSSEMATGATPRPFTPLERSRPMQRRKDPSPDAGVRILPLKEEEEESKWWSWNGCNVPTYEAMPVRSKEGTPDQRKRMFYFQQ